VGGKKNRGERNEGIPQRPRELIRRGKKMTSKAKLRGGGFKSKITQLQSGGNKK